MLYLNQDCAYERKKALISLKLGLIDSTNIPPMGNEESTVSIIALYLLFVPGGRTDSSHREMHTGADTELHMLFSAHGYIFILTQFETRDCFVFQSGADFA